MECDCALDRSRGPTWRPRVRKFGAKAGKRDRDFHPPFKVGKFSNIRFSFAGKRLCTKPFVKQTLGSQTTLDQTCSQGHSEEGMTRPPRGIAYLVIQRSYENSTHISVLERLRASEIHPRTVRWAHYAGPGWLSLFCHMPCTRQCEEHQQ